jgi:putative spermidine/putrescine transport system permease protein
VGAERPERADDALDRGDGDHRGEDPQGDLGVARRQAQHDVGHDGLSAFGQATHEMQRPLIGTGAIGFGGEGRPGEQGCARDVVGAKGGDRGQPGLRAMDGHGHHEAGIDGEVGDDVDEAADDIEWGRVEAVRIAPSGHRPVEAVEHTVEEPQDERELGRSRAVGDARPHANGKPDDGDRVGRHRNRGADPIQQGGHEASGGAVQHAQPVRPKRSVPRSVPLGVVPALSIVAVLLLGAVAGLVRTSLRPGALTGAPFGLGGWRDLWADEAFGDAVVFTARVAVVTTALASVCAVMLAALLRSHGPLVRGAVAVPVAIPHLAVAGVAVLWLAPGGLLERIGPWADSGLIGNRQGWGIVAVYLFKEVPFLTLLALHAWDEPLRQREALAASLGAGPWARLVDIVLPHIGRPLARGAVILGAFVVGATEVPLVVGPSRPATMTTFALDVVRLEGPSGRATAAAALLVTTMATVLAGVLLLVPGRGNRR